jgi:hypothetical protein
MEVDARKQCDKSVLKQKNKIKPFNMADKRRIMELLLCKEDILTKVLIKIFRKIKIKDIEKQYEMEKREAKYRNFSSGRTSVSVRKTQIYQKIANSDAELRNHESKGVTSFDHGSSLRHKFIRSSQRPTPNTNLIHYDGSPPVHMLNQEIKLSNDPARYER